MNVGRRGCWTFFVLFVVPFCAAPLLFAFNSLPAILFFSSLMAVLLHLDVIRVVVKWMAKVRMATMGTSAAGSLAAAADVGISI